MWKSLAQDQDDVGVLYKYWNESANQRHIFFQITWALIAEILSGPTRITSRCHIHSHFNFIKS